MIILIFFLKYLIITKIADGIFTKMRVIKCQSLEILKSVEMKSLFKSANLVSTEVEILQINKSIQGAFDEFNRIPSQGKDLEVFQTFQILNFLYYTR